MLYKNTKEKLRSADRDTYFFDIVTDILQGDTSAPYLFIICLDNALRTSIVLMKEKWLYFSKGKKQMIPHTNDYGRSLRWWHSASGKYAHEAADCLGIHVNADKTKIMCFKQRGDISTLNGRSLKLDKFTYLGSSVLSTENSINTRLAKAWTAIDRLSVIWKSYQSDKIKHSVWMHYMDTYLAYA